MKRSRYFYHGLRVSKPRRLKAKVGAPQKPRRCSCVVLRTEAPFCIGQRIHVNCSEIVETPASHHP